MERIRLKLKAYDHRVLDRTVAAIVEAVKRTGAISEVRYQCLLKSNAIQF